MMIMIITHMLHIQTETSCLSIHASLNFSPSEAKGLAHTEETILNQ